MKERKRLENLYSVEYEHPFDKKALDQLENTRGIDLVTRKALNHGLERYMRIKHTGDNIRITPHNIPEIYEILEEACHIMGIQEIPELHIMLDDQIQSSTSGEKRRIIVMSSGAIELLNSDELLFVFGRELGHIKSNHVIYHMMAHSIKVVAQIISDMTLGLGNMLSMPLQAALLYWHRMSEFTADRAGLLTCQDINIAAHCLIKMAGLPEQYHGRISIQDLREQSEEFEDIKEGTFDKMIRFAAEYDNPQPFTIIRAAQLFKWYDSGAYERVLSRQTQMEFSEMLCPNCQAIILPSYHFCRMCGTKLREKTPLKLASHTTEHQDSIDQQKGKDTPSI